MQSILSRDQLDQFGRHGWVVAGGLLSADELTELDRECARVAAADPGQTGAFYYNEPGHGGAPILRRIERVGAASPLIDRWFHSPRIEGAVGELFGEEACLFKDKLNMKLSGGAGFRAHVDGHFWWTDAAGVTRKGWGEYASWFVNALISIDAGTRENGCIEVASLQDTFAHVGREFDQILAGVDGRGPDIPVERMEKVAMQPIETRPGDIVFFDWRCIHGSAPNRSDTARRLLYATYNRRSEGDHLAAYYEGKRTSAEPLAHKALGGRQA